VKNASEDPPATDAAPAAAVDTPPVAAEQAGDANGGAGGGAGGSPAKGELSVLEQVLRAHARSTVGEGSTGAAAHDLTGGESARGEGESARGEGGGASAAELNALLERRRREVYGQELLVAAERTRLSAECARLKTIRAECVSLAQQLGRDDVIAELKRALQPASAPPPGGPPLPPDSSLS